MFKKIKEKIYKKLFADEFKSIRDEISADARFAVYQFFNESDNTNAGWRERSQNRNIIIGAMKRALEDDVVKIKAEIKPEIQKIINSEEFIDAIIERIKRKQL